MHAHSLTWLAVTVNGMKPFDGHTCVGLQDVCFETHQYLLRIAPEKSREGDYGNVIGDSHLAILFKM